MPKPAKNKKVHQVYLCLIKEYGKQGWWPLTDLINDNSNNKKIKLNTQKSKGYHKGNYDYPKTIEQTYEIALGAILTQAVSWSSAEKAIQNLRKINCLSPNAILNLKDEKIINAIRPAGYFNQKLKKIRIFSLFFQKLNGRIPKREELLDLFGIGPETADSMLLYAFKVPVFVVDAYTKRIFNNLDVIEKKTSYEQIKMLFEANLVLDIKLYQEYHALIVKHAKEYCKKIPACSNCPLGFCCRHNKHKNNNI